jgi:hypothetical protein
MPSKSKEQHNFMAAVANNASFAKKAGVPKSVGEEFMQADKGIKFKGGQQTRPDLQKANSPKTNHGKLTLFNKGGDIMASKMNPKMMAMMAARKKPMMQPGMAQPGTPAMMKKGGMTNMAGGGAMPMKNGKPAFLNDGKGMKNGGMAKGGMHKMPDGKMMKDSAMKKMNMGGMAKGGGVEVKGKTKGTMIKMNMGGMKKMTKGGRAC